MWGFGILLIALAELLSGRRRAGRRRCDVCDRQFATSEDLEAHRRQEHL
jgi:transcriptional regulator NrdR family protein